MTTSTHSRTGFTLIELLLVVMVITILFGILLSAVRTVQRHVLKTVTRAELRGLEGAWKQYYSRHQTWPAFRNEQGILDREMAEGLQGITNSAWAQEYNAEAMPYFEFARFAADGRPLNAWGDSGRHDARLCDYHLVFDYDGVSEVEVPLTADEAGEPVTWTNVPRSVAVWTVDPQERDSRRRVLGSWQR